MKKAGEPSRTRAGRVLLYALNNTQFIVTLLTSLALLHLHSAHSLWFGAGTLLAAFTGADFLPPEHSPEY
jgi:dolichyldiphosphatase